MKNKTLLIERNQLVKLIGRMLMAIVLFIFPENEVLAQKKDKIPPIDTIQVTNAATQTMTSGLTQKEFLPPSPSAAEMTRFSAVQVGLFTGTAQYSIPIYEFKTPNLSLPIVLNYSSNGLMVDKIASWVGFDWSLNAGGVINRYVKGRVDKPNVSRPVYSPSLFNAWTVHEKLVFLEGYTSYDQQDLEPDEFVFSFQNYSGKFVFDEVGNVTLIPYSNLKIESTFLGFKFTTPDGVIYTFEFQANTYPHDGVPFPTSWYLSSILHPAGDLITFNYTKLTFTNYLGVEQSVSTTVATTNSGAVCPSTQILKKVNSVYNDVYFLNSIDFNSHGKIIFEITQNRQDSYQDYKLNKIKITDASNNLIKSFQFFHQFPLCSVSYPSGTTIGLDGTNNEEKKRMFLDSLQIQDDLGNRVNSYKFSYNNLDQLPARYSYSQDHWGYFNGKHNNDFVILSYVPSIYQFNYTNLIDPNTDRNPDPLYSQKGMLQKISFPSGGYNTIEYEANKNISGTQIGGCRVLRTKTFESSSSSPIIKKYNYINQSNSNNNSYYTEIQTYGTNPNDGDIAKCTTGLLSSKSYYNLFSNGQYIVLYPTVEIFYGENGENGKEVHVFYCQYDQVSSPIYGPVFPMPTSNTGWKTGLSDYTSMTNSATTNVWKKDLDYNFTESRNQKEIYCLTVEKRDYPGYPISEIESLWHFNVVPYTLYSIWHYVNQEQITKYQSNGNIVSTTNFTYDANSKGHSMLSKESFASSDESTIETRYYYPQDYSAVQNFSTLISSRIINVPVDTRTYKGTQLISGEQVKYNNYGQPTDVYRAEIPYGTGDIAFNSTNPYTFTPKENIQYNLSKFIKQVTPQDNISTFYLWDSTGKYLMANIEGGGIIWSQVSGYDGLNCDNNSYTLWTSLNIVAPNAKITTFSYLPLKGLTQSTNQMGIKTNYSYDHSGRLSEVKNDDTKLLKKYEYRYATN